MEIHTAFENSLKGAMLFHIIRKSSKISFKNVLLCSQTYVIILLSRGNVKWLDIKLINLESIQMNYKEY